MNNHWSIDYLIQIIDASPLSQSEIEQKAKVARHSIARWKHQRHVPHIDVLDRVLNVLGFRFSIVKI